VTLKTYVGRSLRFFWRNHLAVTIGAAVSTAVLVGALLVGDSVRFSLQRLALLRLGETEQAVVSLGRFFRADLARDLEADIPARVAPVLMLRGLVSTDQEGARVNNVQVIGVDDSFWKLGVNPTAPGTMEAGQCFLNTHLARRLKWQAGDEVVLRMEKPSWIPRDAPMSSDKDLTVSKRLEVVTTVTDEQMGRFSIQASQVAFPTLFVPIGWLQEQVDKAGRANVLLLASKGDKPVTVEQADAQLNANWQLADADLELRELPEKKVYDLFTNRVFVDPEVAGPLRKALPESQGILTYFVNELNVGDKTVPYSTVSAIEPRAGGVVPSDMKENEIILNAWIAGELSAKAGDTVRVKYYVQGPMRKLDEATAEFTVRAIVPMEGSAVDPELMPRFPGLYGAKNCGEWKPGIPIDLKRLSDGDQRYWDKYKGTPKAFITLAAGQKIWNNPFGNLTGVRFSMADTSREKIETAIREAVKPSSIGLFFLPLRQQALEASQGAYDFGQLFIGFSFFLIVAALMLMGLLFVFGIEQRATEIGTLLAVGWTPGKVRRAFLLEGLVLAAIGGAIGTVAGVYYTKGALHGLSTVWQSVVSTSEIYYHATSETLATGMVSGIVVAFIVIWMTVRRQARMPARVLLARDPEARAAQHSTVGGRTRRKLWLAGSIVMLLGALAIIGTAEPNAAGAFFGAGGLLLMAGFGFCGVLLQTLAMAHKQTRIGLAELGARNSTRRRGRSLTIIGLLACGCFMVVAVGAFRHDPTKEAEKRSSGTGGFAVFGETTVALHRDLNDAGYQDDLGLPVEKLKQVTFLPMRVRQGDDASCLNLNRALTPRLLGVNPGELAQRESFTFVGTWEGIKQDASLNPWQLLAAEDPEGAVPAITDQNTIVYALHKSLGDTLVYADERGNHFKVRLVGMISSSILQGNLIIANNRFSEKYPSESGYQIMLIDMPRGDMGSVSAELSRQLKDYGLSLQPAAERLGEFMAVENTYISIFQALGGLGLLLGSVGLGIVVLRNVLERRGELGILRAVGFRRRMLQWMILSEHWMLLVLGLVIGVVTAIVAVLPSLRAPGMELPYVSLGLTLLGMILSGMIWIWLAARAALRGQLIQSLRNE
jgi:ABC-type antimicrobial peptide transport system permease subunit